MKVVVAQRGAREHFAAARALHQQGSLAVLVVDWYAPAGQLGRAMLKAIPKSKAALAARSNHIPEDLVRPLRWLGLRSRWTERSALRRGDSYTGFLATDAAFARAVARLDLPPHDVFFGYSYASLETLEAERARGVFTILDQIDPGPAHFRIVAEEMARHPELADPPAAFPEAYFARLRREWGLADAIVVNSEWTREAIVSEGADPAKIELLPLAYEAEDGTTGRRDDETTRRLDPGTSPVVRSQLSCSPRSGPLRVLFLGTVSIGKGIHYLVEAAKRLAGEAVEFTVAGPLAVRPEAVAKAPPNMRWLGQVPRSHAGQVYAQADVFVFPTLSDGFGLTQLEAMAHGLPVIATPNCGRVVQEGVTGFIVPPRDSQALADAILKFVRNRSLVDEMRPRCLEAVRAFSVENYGRRLIEILERRRGVDADILKN